jgi:hypothetical protein
MDKVISFARQELEKYLEILKVKAEIELHLFDELDIKADVKDPYFDDALAIKVINKKGYIAGINPRSVLFGVYRLLESWGIVWLRPGKDGTFIPSKADTKDVDIFEIAAKRHRTMCIEGAVSIENVLDMVDWMPKMRYNGYYIQFEDSYAFFDRWYSHEASTVKEPEYLDHTMTEKFVEQIEKAVKERGLLLMRMGHGWTCNPFGVNVNGWYQLKDEDIPDSYRKLCALVNGKRDVWQKSPLMTELCYSSPQVRKTMTEAVVEYAKKHPQTDVIHFWLGDYFNNNCECPECTKYRLSDYQTMMVNMITTRFKEENIKAQVVFSIGGNKVHPPVHERVLHPEQTILMFAPMSRTYAVPFPTEYKIKEIPEYKVNGYERPHSVDALLAYLYNWKKQYTGDTVAFEYHLVWDHLIEASGEGIAEVLYNDVNSFDSLGINSFISCQVQRNAFPTSLAMTVLGKTLWNSSVDYEEIKRQVYVASFGEEKYGEMCDYFGAIKKAFYLGNIRSHFPTPKEEYKEELRDAIDKMEAMIPVAKENSINERDTVRKKSWLLIHHHARIYALLARSVLKHISGDKIAGATLRQASVHTAWECEDEIQDAFDCYFYEAVSRSRINLDGIENVVETKKEEK